MPAANSPLLRGWLAVVAVGLVTSSAWAQPSAGEPAAEAKVGKELRAHRITGTPPRLDGRLDDEVWTIAPVIDDLVQNEPVSLAAPTERTTIQVAFDDRYLYVAAFC